MRILVGNDRFDRWRWLFLVMGGAVLLFAAYGTVLTRGPFGINDDYQYLYRVHQGTFDPSHNEYAGMGRLLGSWGIEAVYGLCDGKVARLVWLRAMALLGVGLLAWTLRATLIALRYPAGFATTVAACTALSPACGVFVAWGAAGFAPYALWAALVAGRLLIGPGRWKSDLAASALIVASCATWQAAAPLALFPMLAREWQRTGEDHACPAGRDAKPWWRVWLIAGAAIVVYALICRLLAQFNPGFAAGAGRFVLANDPLAKARLLVALLRDGATSWARLQVGAWEWTVGSLTTAFCVAAIPWWSNRRVRWRRSARRAALAATMLLLSVAPLLAAREDNAAFRSVAILYAVVSFLGVAGASRVLRRIPAPCRVGLTVAGLALTVGAARYHVWHGLVEPNVREYVGLRDQIRRQFPAGPPSHLVYLAPTHTLLVEDRMTPSWEYGLISSTFWWVTRPFLLLIFDETSPQASAKSPDLTISYREAGNPGVPVLDATPVLLREAGEWRDDPRWGRVRAFRGGWTYSPWFGYFNVRYFPAVQHSLLGALWVTSQAQGGGDLWFFHPGLGQFYTKEGVFPHLLLGESKRWVSVSDDNPARLQLSDDETKQIAPYPP